MSVIFTCGPVVGAASGSFSWHGGTELRFSACGGCRTVDGAAFGVSEVSELAAAAGARAGRARVVERCQDAAFCVSEVTGLASAAEAGAGGARDLGRSTGAGSSRRSLGELSRGLAPPGVDRNKHGVEWVGHFAKSMPQDGRVQED